MPEILEVIEEIKYLKKHALGKHLINIKVLQGRYLKKPFVNANFPLKILSVGNKGKFCWMVLENDIVIAITFGMTGTFGSKNKHSQIEFQLSEGESIYFNDVRHFGTITILNKMLLEKKLLTLGLDLSKKEDQNLELFIKKLKKYPNDLIAEVLLKQNIISGIGNYLRAELLYKAKIYPLAPISNLTDKNLKVLYDIIVSYLKKPLPVEIYKCDRDNLGNKVERIIKKGRSIYYVPKIQVIGL